MTRKRRTFEGTLIVRFTAIGLMVTAIAAAAVGYVLQRQLVSVELEEAGTLAVAQMSAIVSPLVSERDLRGAFPPAVTDAIDKAVTGQLRQFGGIVRVKIWARDSTLLYRDDGVGVGTREPDNPELKAALAGEVQAGVSELEKADNATEAKLFNRLLEVYVPLRPRDSKEVLGVYEIYASADTLSRRVSEIRGSVAAGVFGGFALLYAALFGVVAQASRRMVVQANENERLVDEVMTAYDQTIEGWARALELRDKETEGHARRVTDLTVELARDMGIVGGALDDARRGALLHDIGKMGVPDAILLKAGPLNEDERELMRRHPEYGRTALAGIGFIERALEIPYSHHERWDGAGYPEGLAGKAIPLSARIFSVVDVWDALSNDRPYRVAWPQDRVVEYLRAESGSHFDPAVVDVFLRVLARGRWRH